MTIKDFYSILGSGSPQERLAAIEWVEHAEKSEVLLAAHLRAALGDTDAQVRTAAVRALERVAPRLPHAKLGETAQRSQSPPAPPKTESKSHSQNTLGGLDYDERAGPRAVKYIVCKNNRIWDKFTIEEIRALIHAGTLLSTDIVSDPANPGWREISELLAVNNKIDHMSIGSLKERDSIRVPFPRRESNPTSETPAPASAPSNDPIECVSVCLDCFKFKTQPWQLCLHCGHLPTDAVDKLKHLIFTESVMKRSFLNRYSQGRQRNERVDIGTDDVLPGKSEFMGAIFALLERAENQDVNDVFVKNILRSIEDSPELVSKEQVERLFTTALTRSFEDATQVILRSRPNPQQIRSNSSGCASSILLFSGGIVAFHFLLWIWR